ncbi:MAG: hypothetical protein MJ102_01460 [Clostridia bacterium]|nr:hypothetical protein [Clostridia bacterium]
MSEIDLKQLIFDLAGLMSVSGSTAHDSKKLIDLIGGYFDEVHTGAVGNHLFIRRCGKENAPKILVDTHYDEIGMCVTQVKDDGFLTVTNIGGLDTRILQASEVTVYGRDADGNEHNIYGVVGSTPPHLQKPGDANKLKPIDELLIDTGYTKAELEKYVRVGTPVGFRPKYLELKNGLIAGKGFDDKSCGACAVAAIASTPHEELWGDVYLLFSSFEEDGAFMVGASAGAFAVDPVCALVADVNLAHTPDTKKNETVEVNGGVSVTWSPLTDKRLNRILMDEAKEKGIKTQLSVCPGGTGTNATVVGLVGRGIPTVDVGLPLKSMHTCTEVISMEDAAALRDIIALFITSRKIAEDLK